jgi:hypothetical protein
MFSESVGDLVSKYLIPYARMITDALVDAVPQTS